MVLDHDALVKRAVSWLRAQSCPLVLAEMASCREIPDAIGFARHKTIVVECKTSRADFHNDRKKYTVIEHPMGGTVSLKSPRKWREGLDDCRRQILPSMGTERWYLCEPGIVTPEMVAEYHPDHGLLHIASKRVTRIVAAPKRPEGRRDTISEVEYLQFALRHLLDNLTGAGVKVDVLRATKMFGKKAIDLHTWRKERMERERRDDDDDGL